MAVIVERKTDETGRELLVYESGLIKDAQTGHVVKPAPHTLITEENTSEHYRRRVELKQAAALDAANDYVDTLKGDEKPPSKYGDLRYIYSLSQAAMKKALTKSDPKAIEAARFVGLLTGDLEEKGKEEANAQSNSMRDFFKDVVKNLKVEVHLHEGKSSIDNKVNEV